MPKFCTDHNMSISVQKNSATQSGLEANRQKKRDQR